MTLENIVAGLLYVVAIAMVVAGIFRLGQMHPLPPKRPLAKPMPPPEASWEGQGTSPCSLNGSPKRMSKYAVFSQSDAEKMGIKFEENPPSCSDCRESMIRNGAYYKCLNCGNTVVCS